MYGESKIIIKYVEDNEIYDGNMLKIKINDEKLRNTSKLKSFEENTDIREE